MKLIGSNKDFNVYFDANTQEYIVYKNNKFFAKGFFKFSDVKTYLD